MKNRKSIWRNGLGVLWILPFSISQDLSLSFANIKKICLKQAAKENRNKCSYYFNILHVTQIAIYM